VLPNTGLDVVLDAALDSVGLTTGRHDHDGPVQLKASRKVSWKKPVDSLELAGIVSWW
jgi:hypothetical protein